MCHTISQISVLNPGNGFELPSSCAFFTYYDNVISKELAEFNFYTSKYR